MYVRNGAWIESLSFSFPLPADYTKERIAASDKELMSRLITFIQSERMVKQCQIYARESIRK
jgi:hypothetical protein